MYKFWRLINIEQPSKPHSYIDGMRLEFMGENVLSNDPSKGFALNSYDDELYKIGHAFDNDDTTFFVSARLTSEPWYIGYNFETEVLITHIVLKARENYLHRAIQFSDIEVSNDGQNWQYYGSIFPKITDLETKVCKIHIPSGQYTTTSRTYGTITNFIPKRNPKDTAIVTSTHISSNNYHPINANQLYTYDAKVEGWGGNGYIEGKTQKLGVDVPNIRVCCYFRKTGKLMGMTWSDDNCQYRFDNLIPSYEYYVHAIDNDCKFNAVTQDILIAKEVEI